MENVELFLKQQMKELCILNVVLTVKLSNVFILFQFLYLSKTFLIKKSPVISVV